MEMKVEGGGTHLYSEELVFLNKSKHDEEL